MTEAIIYSLEPEVPRASGHFAHPMLGWGRNRARSPTTSYVAIRRETCSVLRYFGWPCRCPPQQPENSRPDACRLRNPAHL